MVDGAIDVSCLEVFVFSQFEMTTLQLLKESLKKKSKSCIKNCNDLLSIRHIIIYSNSLRSSLYDFHIFITSSSSFHGFITNQFNDLLPVGLLAQLVRALHQYCKSRNCKSCICNCDDLLLYYSSPCSSHI